MIWVQFRVLMKFRMVGRFGYDVDVGDGGEG